MTTHERKESRRDRSIKIATWNLQGHLSQPMEMAQLSRDMRDRNIKICCIQETQNSFEGEYNIDNGDLILFMGGNERGYGGLAFYIAREWKDKIVGQRRVSPRIATINFKYQHQRDNGMLVQRRMTIISVAHHGVRTII